jgi:glycosyltransferase involved in cell wall biosynthesis
MNPTRPRISVIMPVFNTEKYLAEAVASVRAQTFGDWELLIVDDGSSDDSLSMARSFAKDDARISVIPQEHAGASAAHNRAAEAARADWLAVADADDVQLPQRFERLWAKIEKDPSIGVCGGAVEVWHGGPEAGYSAGWPCDDAGIRAGMVFESTIFNPTVLYRKSLLGPPVNGHDRWFTMAHDYDLWARMLGVARFANIPETLTRYRRHPTQITQSAERSGRSLRERRRIWIQLCASQCDVEPSDAELDAHLVIATWPSVITPAARDAAGAWLERLYAANRDRRRLPVEAFNRELARRWLAVCAHTADRPVANLRRLFKSPLGAGHGVATSYRFRQLLYLVRGKANAASKAPA